MRSRKLMATVLSTALAMNSLSGAAVTKADSDGSTGEARGIAFTQSKNKDYLYADNDDLALNFELAGADVSDEVIATDGAAHTFNVYGAATPEDGYDIIAQDCLAVGAPMADAADGTGEFTYANNVIKNRYIGLFMANGSYSIGTEEGDPFNSQDNNKKLVYGHPRGTSSCTTINIDGTPIRYAPSSSRVDLDNGSIETTLVKNGLTIVQKGTIVNNPITGRKDNVCLKYTVTNTDDKAHNVGVRIMFDTMLGDNDSAPFRVPGFGGVTNNLEITGDDIPQYYQVFDNLSNPSVVAQGTFYTNNDEKPDRVLFATWSKVNSGHLWDVNIGTGTIGDSAVATYWNPTQILPGEVKEYSTYYGCGEVSSDVVGHLNVGVTGVSTLEATDEGYSPNPFTVTGYAYNDGVDTIENVSAKIVLPEGLHLTEGESDELSIGNLVSMRDNQVSWDVEADLSEEDKTVTYKVQYFINGTFVKEVERELFIPEYLDNVAGKNVILKTDINTDKFDFDAQDITVAPASVEENADGTTTLTWNFEKVYIDDVNDIIIPLSSDNLIPGETALICKNTVVEYTDKSGERHSNSYADMEIPVRMYSLDTTIATDKDEYNSNEDVTIDFTAANLRDKDVNANVKVELFDEAGELVDTIDTFENDSIEALATNEYQSSFNTLRTKAGVYTIKCTWLKGNLVIGECEKNITILSVLNTLDYIDGNVTLSDEVISPADTLTITAELINGSNEDLTGLNTYVTVVRVADGEQMDRWDFVTDIEADTNAVNEVEFAKESLERGQYIVSYYGVKADGTTKLFNSDTFRVAYIEDDFEDESGLWNYMGSAYRSEEGYAVLTHNENHQAGAMWLKKGIDKPFVVSFKYYEGDGNSADGFVMMFAKNPNELGNEGRELAFTEGNGYGVEFDSFYNKFHTEQTAIESKHIALIKDKLSAATPGGVIKPLAINLEDKFAGKLGDAQWHDVEVYVNYDGVMVYVDGERAIEYKGEIVFDYDGFGFAGSTGTSNDNQYIDDVVIRENTSIKKEVSDSRTFVGSAHESEEGYIVLTEDEEWQAGAMWIDDVVSAPFNASFKYKSAGEGNIADGFVFMFNKKADVLGNNGSFMGFENGNGYGVEFDSFFNTNESEHAAAGLKHIALTKNYLASSNKAETINALALTTDETFTSVISDGEWHDVDVKVRKDGLKLYIDGELALTYNGTFDDTYTSVGFAAATGAYSQYTYIDDVVIDENIEKTEYTVTDTFTQDLGLWNHMGSSSCAFEGFALINPAITWQAGAMWLRDEIGTEFETSFDYLITSGDGNADGFTYMFYKKADELGNNGSSMGFAEGSGYAIEFDTYNNGTGSEKMGCTGRHIALVKNATSGNAAQVLAYVDDADVVAKLTDGLTHSVVVKACPSQVRVYLDGELIINYEGVLDTTYRNTGFSGATGGLSESHAISNFACTYAMYE